MKRSVGISLFAALLLSQSAQAATDTWNGGSNDWNTTGNWSGGTPIVTSTATFSGTANPGVTLSAAGTALSIAFTGTPGAYTIGTTGGPAITLATGGSISTVSTVANVETVNAPLVLGSGSTAVTYSFTSSATSSANTLNIGGQVSSGTSGTTTLSLNGTNAGANTISGNLVNGSGTLAVTENGSGAWTLSGTGNSYTGATAVSSGTLNLTGSLTGATAITVSGTGVLNETSTGVIGSAASSLTINSGTVTLAGANTFTGTTTLAGGTLNINNASALGATSGLNFTATGASTLDNTSAAAITLSNNPVISFVANSFVTFGGTKNLNLGTGAVSQAGNVTFTMSGTGSTLTLGGVYTGIPGGSIVTTVNGAGNTLVLGAYALSGATATVAGNEQFAGSGNVTINGAVSDGPKAGGQIAYSGTGTLTLAGADTNTGPTLIKSGTMILTGSVSNSPLSVQGGAFLETSTGSLTGSSLQTSVTAGTATFQGVNSNTVTLGTNVSGGTLIISGTSGSFTSTSGFNISANTGAAGTLILDNTTAAGGNNSDRINNASALGLNGGNFIYRGADAASTNSTETIGSISGTGASTVSIVYGGTNTATFTTGSFSHAGGNGTDLVNGVNLGQNSSGTSSLSRLIITTAPTLIGGTAATSTGIAAGTFTTSVVPFMVGEATSTTGGLGTATGVANTFLTYNATTGLRPLNPTDEFNNNAIATGNNTYITAATAAGATASINSLVINGGDLTIGSGFTLTNASGALLFASNNSIKAGSASSIYTPGTVESQITVDSGVTGTINAIVGGTATNALTKSGTGTLVLSGADTYTGITTVAAGILNVQNATALGTATGTTANGSVVSLGGTLQIQGVSIGNEALTLGGPGATAAGATGALENVSGTNTYGGLVTLLGASNVTTTISVDAGSLSLTNAGIITGAYALGLAGAGNGSIASAIGTGTGTVSKTGTGTWTLTGANTYTGATTVSLGTLALGSGGSLGGTVISVGSAATPVSGVSGNATLQINGNYTMGTAALGSLTIKGGNTGGTPLGQGTLSLVDGTTNTLTLADNVAGDVLTIGSKTNANPAIVNMEVGATSDSIVVGSGTSSILIFTGATAGTTANIVNLTGLGSLDGNTHTLISGTVDGSTAGHSTFAQGFVLGTTSGNFGGYTLALGNTASSLTVTEVANAAPTVAFWNGTNGNGLWNSFTNGNTNTSNFLNGIAGTNDNGLVGATTDVTFNATGATNFVNTTLGQDFSIKSLTFNTTGVGIGGANTLTVGTAGIAVATGAGAGTDTISSNLALGGNQTWTVTDAANTLAASGVVSGGSNTLTKAGSGTVVLSGTAANTYTGLTTVSSGELDLNKTAGVNALAGNASITGGTLKLLASNQIADTASVSISSGALNFNNLNETFKNLTNSGGVVSYGTGTVSITDPTWSGGTNDINGHTTFGELTVSGGTNTVYGSAGAAGGPGVLTVGGATDSVTGDTDLTFSGTASPTIALNSDNGTAGKLVLAGNVTSTVTAGTASITSVAGGVNPGQVDLGGATRSITVADGTAATDMSISAKIINGGVTKAGAGTLALSGTNIYSGGTTVSGGSLVLANTAGSATGTGTLTVSAGATLAGTGISSGTSFSIAGTGTGASAAKILVGQAAGGDSTIGNTTTLKGSAGTAAVPVSNITNANLVFNLNVSAVGGTGLANTTPGASNQLSVGATDIGFGTGVNLTLNLVNEPGVIALNTPYVLIAGNNLGSGTTSQYSGLGLTGATTVGTITTSRITNLTLSYGNTQDQTWYGAGSYLLLYQDTSTGIDDIEVEVVPEPSTYAMIIGGLAVLCFWQRRRSKNLR